ncbi:hypothetical protein F3Y22_tig00110944pilonHSYRG00027 [Hibiscus syriacus]|uniref:Conserved oligomeric Golgi complex subunit 3 N-terminal domain-containing protein n=1 Tax=Hibiscus syriacus TaxID=106335 RepID=A0A6A2ZAX0_HIBSY|nr:hypothetical protein F3Y22_tig00110944pilonHSYRG00027 [Hibiscus syriacus]
MNVGNENFFLLLKQLDECISYVESNPQYAESNVYLLKFRQLQSWALGMIRSHVLSVLRSASSQVQAAIRSSGGNKASLSEGVEASVIYIRFKAAASELKSVSEEIESRASRKEYVHVLAECHKLCCEQRLWSCTLCTFYMFDASGTISSLKLQVSYTGVCKLKMVLLYINRGLHVVMTAGLSTRAPTL